MGTAFLNNKIFKYGFGLDVIKKQVLFLLVLFSGLSWGQVNIFTESMGTVGANTTIAAHETANGFDNDSYFMSGGGATNPADIRNSSNSNNAGASGGANVFFTTTNAQYGFAIEGIDASSYSSLTLDYGYRKEAAAAHATFAVEYWNGSSWVSIASTAGNLFNETATATAGWYAAKQLSLPAAAQISGLRIRFLKSGTTSIRIDDILLRGVLNTSLSGVTAGASVEPASFPSTTTSITGASAPQTNAVLNFDFTVTDDANTTSGNDALPTLISQIIIPQGAGNDIANWSQAIAGAQLSDGTNTINGTIAASTLTFASIPNGTGSLGEITDGSAKTYSLRIWLNNALGGTLPTTIDGLNLAFKIDRTNFTTASAATSTQFESGAGTVVESGSTNNAVDVVATNLNFVVQPSNVNQNANMSPPVTISANDPNGNRDLGYSSNVSLASTGTMTGDPIEVAASSGLATYNNSIAHTVSGSGLFLSATSGSLTATGNSSSFNVIALTPIIDVTGQAHNSTSAFGNVVLGNTLDRTFTINNTGTATMTISSLSFGGSGFAIQGATPTTVAVGGNATFTVRFTPNAIGAFTGSVTINNDSSNQTAFIINFTGTGTPSNVSDIILSGMTYTSNIDYTTSQAVAALANTTGSVAVMGITIRDGGASASDADVLPTILTGITFSSIAGTNMIRTAALFDGSTMVANIPSINVGANTIAFSGLNYSCDDNSTRNLTLRISFLPTVTDNLQMTFTVTNANVAAAGSNSSSIFTAFTSVVSSIAGDSNRIEVTADRLAFVQQPSNTGINGIMSPAVTVTANDSNNNRDLDFTNAVNITSTGTLTTTPNTASAVAGLATFSAITHNVIGTGLTLSAASGSLTGVTSTAFTIENIVYVTNDYRTIAGTGLVWTTVAHWQRFDGTNWVAAAAFPPNSSTTYILGSISTGSGSNRFMTKVVILSGGVLTINGANFTTSTQMLVKAGGLLQINANVTNNGTFEIEDNATVNFNYSSFSAAELSTSLWNGTEDFRPNSNFVIQNQGSTAAAFFIPSNTDITANSYNGFTACFGNLIFDSTATTTFPFYGTSTTFNRNITHNDLIMRSSTFSSNAFRMLGSNTFTSSLTTTIGRDLILESGFNRPLTLTSTGTTTINLTIKGSLINNSASAVNLTTNSSGSVTLNVDGDIVVSNSGIVNLASAGTATINLKGDLSVSTNALLNSAVASVFNFTGTGNGLTAATTQTIDIATINANENRFINFNVKSGAYTKLLNSNFELGTNSKLTVENGGVLDFGFNGSNALLVAISGSQTGTAFESMTGSTLKITSPDGITTIATPLVGNVTNATRTFASDASFEYIGIATPQFTGNALPSSVRNLVVNNTAVSAIVKLTNSVAVTNNLGLTTGVLETVACNASTSGTPLLTMNAGSFVTPTGGSSASYVSGVMQKVGNTSFKFPIGGNGQYAPLSISGASAATDSFSTCYNQVNPLTAIGTAKAANVNDINNCEYWHLNSTPASISTQITLDLNDARCAIPSPLCRKVVGWSGTEWQSLGNNAETSTSIQSAPTTLRGPITWSSNVLSVLPNLTAADAFAKAGFGTHVTPKPNFPGGVSGGFIAFDSDSKGLVIPRVSSANRPTGVAGLLIYNTDLNCIQMHNGTTWKCIEISCGN